MNENVMLVNYVCDLINDAPLVLSHETYILYLFVYQNNWPAHGNTLVHNGLHVSKSISAQSDINATSQLDR